mgnify:FL=1
MNLKIKKQIPNITFGILIVVNINNLLKNYFDSINTLCFLNVCNIEILSLILLFSLIIIFIFIHKLIEVKYSSKFLNFALFIPLVFSAFDAKGNEIREFGLSYMLSNNKEFILDWNGNVFTEQLFFISIFSNIAQLFDEFLNFLYFSRILIFLIFIFSVLKFLEDEDSLKVVFIIYFANFISLTFGGEYLLSGGSTRTLAYSFAFLSIYHLRNNSKYFYLFSFISALFHIHVYLYLIIPYLFFGNYKKDNKQIILFSLQTGLVLLYLFTAHYFFSNVSKRSSFIEKLTQQYNDEYVSLIIAREIIPFHVMPFNFGVGETLINTNWRIGFLNFFILIILFFILKSFNEVFMENKLITFYIIFLIFALLTSYFDKNSILSFLYLFKPTIILSLLLAINLFKKINRNLVRFFLATFLISWIFYFPVKYINYEIQTEKYQLIAENSTENFVVVIENNIRKFFPSNFVNDNFEEYLINNNDMSVDDIILRKQLSFENNYFCEKLGDSLNLMVITSKKLDCGEYSFFSINKYYGNSGIVGDPYFVYTEDSCALDSSCLYFYTNY